LLRCEASETKRFIVFCRSAARERSGELPTAGTHDP
jgi:hypothetical protein